MSSGVEFDLAQLTTLAFLLVSGGGWCSLSNGNTAALSAAYLSIQKI